MTLKPLLVMNVLALLLSNFSYAEGGNNLAVQFSDVDTHIDMMVDKYALRGASLILASEEGRI